MLALRAMSLYMQMHTTHPCKAYSPTLIRKGENISHAISNVFPNTIKNLKKSIQISVLAHNNLIYYFKMDSLLIQTYSTKAILLLFCLFLIKFWVSCTLHLPEQCVKNGVCTWHTPQCQQLVPTWFLLHHVPLVLRSSSFISPPAQLPPLCYYAVVLVYKYLVSHWLHPVSDMTRSFFSTYAVPCFHLHIPFADFLPTGHIPLHFFL